MRRNRCIHSIIYDLLKLLVEEQPVKKTRLCTGARLPLDRCTPILQLLVEKGLVYTVVEDESTYYYIADNGYIYIGVYEKLQGLIGEA